MYCYHNNTRPGHINFLWLTCVRMLQLSCWNTLSWCSTGWLLRTTHVSSLFLCLFKNIFIPQHPPLILPVLLTEGSCDLDPDVTRMLQFWLADALTILDCWGLAKWRRFPFFINFRKFLGVGLKQRPWRYLISSVFVLSLVMIAWSEFPNGIEIGIYHNPSVLFLYPLKLVSNL